MLFVRRRCPKPRREGGATAYRLERLATVLLWLWGHLQLRKTLYPLWACWRGFGRWWLWKMLQSGQCYQLPFYVLQSIAIHFTDRTRWPSRGCFVFKTVFDVTSPLLTGKACPSKKISHWAWQVIVRPSNYEEPANREILPLRSHPQTSR